MPLQLGSRTAILDGAIVVEDAETLATWLRSAPAGRVNLRRCTSLHTAALQALIAARPKLSSPPDDPFLRAYVLPLLQPAETVSAETVAAEAAPAPIPGDVDVATVEVAAADVTAVEVAEPLDLLAAS